LKKGIFVVSTSHLDPLDQFQKLIIEQQQTYQQQQQQASPKWFFPNAANTYKYFVLLHDVQEGEISTAHQTYEALKNSYGSSNCHLLQINSKKPSHNNSNNIMTSSTTSTTSTTSTLTINDSQIDPWLQYSKFNQMYSGINGQNNSQNNDNTDEIPLKKSLDQIEHPLNGLTSPDPLNHLAVPQQQQHGMCLALSDHDRVKTFISEFVQRGLVPYAERTIKTINEQIQSKRGILKNMSITKRFTGFFSSSSSTSAASSSSLSPVKSSLPPVSISNVSGGSINSNNSNSNVTLGGSITHPPTSSVNNNNTSFIR
jgi:trafficking protein particle complex subunit 8